MKKSVSVVLDLQRAEHVTLDQAYGWTLLAGSGPWTGLVPLTWPVGPERLITEDLDLYPIWFVKAQSSMQ